jgi:hypothetical protein
LEDAVERFEVHISGPSDDIANHVTVEADASFVRVITDSYEGTAQMSFETAALLIPALARAVEYARSADAQRDKVAEAKELCERLSRRANEPT